jgi:NADH dehydrogenase FAD-containing subunit
MMTSTSTNRHRVVIAGDDVAAPEAAMALRARSRDRISTVMLLPEDHPSDRGVSAGEPFGHGQEPRIALVEIARDLDLEYTGGTLDSVEPAAGVAHLADGSELAYDSLIVATGAKRVPTFAHGLTFHDQEGSEAVHGLNGRVRPRGGRDRVTS